MSEIKYDGGLTCSIDVLDLEKSLEFYEKVLEFELLYKLDDLKWCELKIKTDNVNIGLSQVEEVKKGGGATLVFGVENIDNARQHLEKKGVTFFGPTREIEGMVKLADFSDPDENRLTLYEDIQTKK
jgi:predicted enzyme related to lactoylglutathione lyase